MNVPNRPERFLIGIDIGWSKNACAWVITRETSQNIMNTGTIDIGVEMRISSNKKRKTSTWDPRKIYDKFTKWLDMAKDKLLPPPEDTDVIVEMQMGKQCCIIQGIIVTGFVMLRYSTYLIAPRTWQLYTKDSVVYETQFKRGDSRREQKKSYIKFAEYLSGYMGPTTHQADAYLLCRFFGGLTKQEKQRYLCGPGATF